MGVWATGLYAGDFALDLRSTIAAVAKLPFDGGRLLEILCKSNPRQRTGRKIPIIPPSGWSSQTSSRAVASRTSE